MKFYCSFLAAIIVCSSVFAQPFVREAFEIRALVSRNVESDKKIIEYSRWDYGDEVFDEDNNVIAVWMPVSPDIADNLKNNKTLVFRENPQGLHVLVKLDKNDLNGEHIQSIQKYTETEQKNVFGLQIDLTVKGANILKAILESAINNEVYVALLSDETVFSAERVRFQIAKNRFVSTFSGEFAEKQVDSWLTKINGASAKKFAEKEDEWQPLFDGKTLDGWEKPEVGGEGDVKIENGVVVIEAGASLSGIRRTKLFPKIFPKIFPKLDYEIEYEARKMLGGDFFAACTFPVGRSHLTFINGGWGGGVVGLSNIDGRSADDNETASYNNFADKNWYRFRIRVTSGKILCWIDNEPVVDIVIMRRKVALRFGADMFKPFGFTTWITTGEIRNAQYRLLTQEESESQNRQAQEYVDRFVR